MEVVLSCCSCFSVALKEVLNVFQQLGLEVQCGRGGRGMLQQISYFIILSVVFYDYAKIRDAY